MPLLRAACSVSPPLGAFAGVCLIPDFPCLSTTSARAGILYFFNLLFFMYLSLAGLGLHRCMGFSLVAVSRGCSSLRCPGLSCCGAEAVGLTGFSSCRAQDQWLTCTGLVASRHVGSSQTRDQTCVSCSGRWVLIPCATREGGQGFHFSCSPVCPPSDR